MDTSINNTQPVKKILIVGLAQGGLDSLYNYLKDLGDFPLNEVGTNGSISWVHAIQSNDYPSHFTKSIKNWENLQHIFGNSVFVQRHPLYVIDAIYRHCLCGIVQSHGQLQDKDKDKDKDKEKDGQLSWDYVSRHLGKKLSENDLLSAARYYYEWNMAIMTNFPSSYQIHAESTNIFDFLSFIGANTSYPSLSLPNTFLKKEEV